VRGRRRDLVCGDRVLVVPDGSGRGIIEDLAPRENLLYRSDLRREKLIAANVTQIAVVVAPVPPFSADLVNRCLAAAEDGAMKALIVLNKADLPESRAARHELDVFGALGYPIIAISARRDVGPLRSRLKGETSVLVGQSGMGKSTIVNALVPRAAARTAEVSTALGTGRHTTTHAELYRLDDTTELIDSPGIQSFGLSHLSVAGAAHAFVEFREHLGRCRFRDCAHLDEPGCAIAAACEAGNIAPLRLASYRKLAKELGREREAGRR
jgi:ribosome biogenesis GTPase